MKEKKTRLRRKNFGFKKLIIWAICILIIIQLIRVIVPATTTFSRYVYSIVRSYYLNAKNFYFNSDKLRSEEVAKFELDNWSGKDYTSINISLNSRKNNLEFAQTDVAYELYFNYTLYKANGNQFEDQNLLDVSIRPRDPSTFERATKENDSYQMIKGVIMTSNQNRDNVLIKFTPNNNVKDDTFKTGDYLLVNIIAESTSPYKKTLRGQFKIIVGELGMSYVIEDKPYQPYCEVRVTNTLDYYKVINPFGTHNIGDVFTIPEYMALPDNQKANCRSAGIKMNFDPNQIVIDTASGIYMDAAQKGNVTTTKKGQYDYINSINFNLDAEESKVVKFYKIDPSKDYTYPMGPTGPNSIVDIKTN